MNMSYQDFNKSEYLRHPELKLLFRKEYIRFFLLIHIPFYIMVFFTRDFPDFLATMDATIMLLAIGYSLFIKPLMMKGKIRAYYRRHYRTNTTGSFLSVVYTGLWFGTMLRSILLVVNFLIQYFSFEKNDIPPLVAGMKMNYMDSNGAIAGVVLFCLYVYILYYKDRYISIQEFSNRAMRYVKERGFRVEDAMAKVLYERQAELEKEAIQYVKYDANKDTAPANQPVSHLPVQPQPAVHMAEEIQVPEKQELPNKNLPESIVTEEIVPMRRKARK